MCARSTPSRRAAPFHHTLPPHPHHTLPPRPPTAPASLRSLYNCGKVCLSLLGTWAGPGWVPDVSTLSQVFLAVQGQILIENPYCNEPGYEGYASMASEGAQRTVYGGCGRAGRAGEAGLCAQERRGCALKSGGAVHSGAAGLRLCALVLLAGVARCARGWRAVRA